MSNCRTCVIALGSLETLVTELFSCLDKAHWQVFVASRYHIQQCAPSRQLSSLVTKRVGRAQDLSGCILTSSQQSDI